MSESGQSEPTAANSPVDDLKREAKWAADPETQKESIEELGSHGTEAIAALEEVKTVTAHEDIRKEVDAAIRDITRKETNTAEERTKKKRSSSSSRKAVNKNKGKSSNKSKARKSSRSSSSSTSSGGATKSKKNSRKKSSNSSGSKGRRK